MSEVAVLEKHRENRGGRRPGSGRKPGMPNKFTRAERGDVCMHGMFVGHVGHELSERAGGVRVLRVFREV